MKITTCLFTSLGGAPTCSVHAQYDGEDLTTVDVQAHAVIGAVMVSGCRRHLAQACPML